eukprot:1883000-Rhodomonas_salina.1
MSRHDGSRDGASAPASPSLCRYIAHGLLPILSLSLPPSLPSLSTESSLSHAHPSRSLYFAPT